MTITPKNRMNLQYFLGTNPSPLEIDTELAQIDSDKSSRLCQKTQSAATRALTPLSPHNHRHDDKRQKITHRTTRSTIADASRGLENCAERYHELTRLPSDEISRRLQEYAQQKLALQEQRKLLTLAFGRSPTPLSTS